VSVKDSRSNPNFHELFSSILWLIYEREPEVSAPELRGSEAKQKRVSKNPRVVDLARGTSEKFELDVRPTGEASSGPLPGLWQTTVRVALHPC